MWRSPNNKVQCPRQIRRSRLNPCHERSLQPTAVAGSDRPSGREDIVEQSLLKMMVRFATSKWYTRAVLRPTILACSSWGNSGKDLARSGKRRLAVRIVRVPHHAVDADDVAQANADGILLEAQDDVAVEEVAGPHSNTCKSNERITASVAISFAA